MGQGEVSEVSGVRSRDDECRCAFFQAILNAPDYECALCSSERHAEMFRAHKEQDRRYALLFWAGILGALFILVAALLATR